jgi:DNA-binding transcriptional regulator YiaG
MIPIAQWRFMMEIPKRINPFSGTLAGKDLQEFRRKELDLSQKGLADCLGVSVRTVQGWEIGKSRPMAPIVRLIKLFKFIPAAKKMLCPSTCASEPKQ